MKIILKSIIALMTMGLLTGCPEDLHSDIVEYLKIINNSSKDIVYMPIYILKSDLNDTLLKVQTTNNWVEDKYVINIHSTKDYELKEYNKRAIENDYMLSLYFFDRDTLALLPWEQIVTKNIILRRVDFHSWEELEDINFEVKYP